MAAKYDPQLKRQAVEAYHKERPGFPSDAAALRYVAAQFNVPAATLRDWVKAAPADQQAPAAVVVIPAERASNKDRAGVDTHVVEIVGAPDPETLEGTFRASVAAMDWLKDTDNALVRTGLEYARQIDKVIQDPEVSATDKTKALYLGPHLINALKELGGTPGSRKDLTQGEGAIGGKLAALRAVEDKRGKGKRRA